MLIKFCHELKKCWKPLRLLASQNMQFQRKQKQFSARLKREIIIILDAGVQVDVRGPRLMNHSIIVNKKYCNHYYLVKNYNSKKKLKFRCI